MMGVSLICYINQCVDVFFTRDFIACFAAQYGALDSVPGQSAAVSGGKFYVAAGADFSRATALNRGNSRVRNGPAPIARQLSIAPRR
jgi:hypothetical protein